MTKCVCGGQHRRPKAARNCQARLQDLRDRAHRGLPPPPLGKRAQRLKKRRARRGKQRLPRALRD